MFNEELNILVDSIRTGATISFSMFGDNLSIPT